MLVGLFGRIVDLFGYTVGLFWNVVLTYAWRTSGMLVLVGLFGRILGLFWCTVGLFWNLVLVYAASSSQAGAKLMHELKMLSRTL